jgi:hypothetical protein
VSKPTVFASVGNKRALLKAARDLAMASGNEPVPIAERSWFQQALAEPDPGQSVRLHARNVTGIHRCAGDVVEVLRVPARADEELGNMWPDSFEGPAADGAVCPCVPPEHHDHDQDAHNALTVTPNVRGVLPSETFATRRSGVRVPLAQA